MLHIRVDALDDGHADVDVRVDRRQPPKVFQNRAVGSARKEQMLLVVHELDVVEEQIRVPRRARETCKRHRAAGVYGGVNAVFLEPLEEILREVDLDERFPARERCASAGLLVKNLVLHDDSHNLVHRVRPSGNLPRAVYARHDALPAKGAVAPAFTLVKTDLSEVTLDTYKGKKVVLNIFPSIDTPVCANSVRQFNKTAGEMSNAVVLCISADLPFAHSRFCETDGLKNVESMSVFRSPAFGKDYGVTITTGPIAGLLSRAIVVLGADGKVVYTEQVPEITQEPNYDAALAALK